MMYMGIDPGSQGGIAIININHKLVLLHSLSKLTKSEIADIIYKQEIMDVTVLIEDVHAMRHDGVSSAFKFGRSHGFLEGCVCTAELPYDFVSPQKWQTTLGLAGKRPNRKKAHKEKAQQLFPEYAKVITQENADAILIAEYNYRLGVKRLTSK